MHIVINKSNLKNSKKTYQSILLMESYREDDKVKKRTVEVAIYVTMSRIEKTRWKNPMPLVKSSLYELRQMFNSKFFKETQLS